MPVLLVQVDYKLAPQQYKSRVEWTPHADSMPAIQDMPVQVRVYLWADCVLGPQLFVNKHVYCAELFAMHASCLMGQWL